MCKKGSSEIVVGSTSTYIHQVTVPCSEGCVNTQACCP